LLIQLWGKIDMNFQVVIDRNGQIALPKLGVITVAGLRYGELQGFLSKQFATFYKDFEINVTLGKLRSIQIFVLGNARQPGSYTVSAFSTLLDALFASGGPSAEGSMRRIELRRQGTVAAVFDVYDAEQKGDKSHDERLLAGDVIFIPPIGPQAALEGSIEQPGIYELKANETLGGLLDGSGGLTGIASTEHIVLERVQDHKQLQVEAFDLTDSVRQRILHDGDIVRISPLILEFKEEVTVRGNLAWPGRYPWHEGLRVTDLIPSRDALLTRNYWTQHNRMADQQNLVAAALAAKSSKDVSNPADDGPCPTLTEDTTVASQMANSGQTAAEQIPLAQSNSCAVQNSGSMQNPGKTGPGTRFADAASGAQAGVPVEEGQSVLPGPTTNDMQSELTAIDAEINWNYAVIERLDSKDLSTQLIPFNLGKAIDHPGLEDDPPHRSGDIITVFSSNDISLPVGQQAIFVRVSGEVNAPGVYRMDPSDTLRDLVRRAGGLTDHAYLFGSRLNRLSARVIQRQQLQISMQRMKNEILYESAMSFPTTLQSTSPAAVLGQTAQMQQAN
jgi:protein involved in polysaccharide export with SLBB domain